MYIKYLSCFTLIALFYSLATPLHAANIKDGEAKAVNCISCHGPNGVSTNAQFPTLAGQQSTYLANQLNNFKNRSRMNPIMNGMASNLSDDDIQNLAAYFSSQKPKSAGGDPDLAKIGESKTPICMGCHSTKAKGNGQFPRLAGQHPEYLSKQLISFKTGERKAGAMNAVAANLSEEDIKAIAAYLGSL